SPPPSCPHVTCGLSLRHAPAPSPPSAHESSRSPPRPRPARCAPKRCHPAPSPVQSGRTLGNRNSASLPAPAPRSSSSAHASTPAAATPPPPASACGPTWRCAGAARPALRTPPRSVLRLPATDQLPSSTAPTANEHPDARSLQRWTAAARPCAVCSCPIVRSVQNRINSKCFGSILARLPASGVALVSLFLQWKVASQYHKTTPQAQPPALQCATLGAFGGFFDRGFRAHDYALGRRNCQKFLSDSFVLPMDNVVIKAGLDGLDSAARDAVINQFKRSAPGTYA